VNVLVGSTNCFATSFFSRFCSTRVLYPSPHNNLTSYVVCLKSILRRYKPVVLMPQSDTTLLSVSRFSRFIKGIKTSLPSADVVELALDKSKTLAIAVDNDIPVPNTELVCTFKEAREMSKRLKYPVVVKPKSSVFVGENKIVKSPRTLHAAGPAEFLKRLQILISFGVPPPVIVQEYVPGEQCGFSAIVNWGKPRVVFMWKRITTFPATGGPSVLRESTYDREIMYFGLKMLKVMNWHGTAMVEFRYDAGDKKPKMLEVNGRFWGSLRLAIVSGVDFPYLLYKMVTEGDIKRSYGYRVGVRCRWISGELIRLYEKLVNGKSLFPSGSLKCCKAPNFDEITMNDPLPLLGSLLSLLEEGTRRRHFLNSWRKAASIGY